jgi:hypothetical protein
MELVPEGKKMGICRNYSRKRKYRYNVDPPKEFIELTIKMNKLNEKLLETTDPEENMSIFHELMTISQKMQEMGKFD